MDGHKGEAATPPRHHHMVAIYQDENSPAEHFLGVEAALNRRGVMVEQFTRASILVPLDPVFRVVAVSEFQSAQSRRLLREARAIDATTLLLMDGIVEWRNTFRNPHVEAGFLRPAPCDVIACAGRIDAHRLRSWGNIAIPTGLPRLAPLMPGQRPRGAGDAGPATGTRQPRVLIATARNPVWSPEEEFRVLAAIRCASAALQRAGAEVVWRVGPALASRLKVRPDDRPLAEVLASCSAAITTASTLLIECMAAGLPTGLLRAYGAAMPMWQSSVWMWPDTLRERRAFDAEAPDLAAQLDPHLLAADGLDAFVQGLLHPRPRALLQQDEILRQMHAMNCDPADAVAELIVHLIQRPLRNENVRRRPVPCEVVRMPRHFAPAAAREHGQPADAASAQSGLRARRQRIVNCVTCEGTSVGGVTTWAWRLARELECRPELGYDAVTLLIGTSPDAIELDAVPDWARATTRVCQLDPTLDAIDQLTFLRAAIERLDPDLILPNYCDLAYMAGTQIRAASHEDIRRGESSRSDCGPIRMIACAHTDDAYYQRLIAFYDRWDAAVAVSGRCVEWLGPMVEARSAARRRAAIERGAHVAAGSLTIPLHRIVYGVPVRADLADPAEQVDDTAHPVASRPLEIAYIGRMVQWQKRLFDFLTLVDELENRQVSARLHMIGEGSDLNAFRQRLRDLRARREGLRWVEVVIHGRRSPDDVQELLHHTIDVSVLLSEFEGTSITMLEAMGAGVVPAVTAVESGVDEWVRDDENGVGVPVGRPDLMADRLAGLAQDRPTLKRLAQRAWETVRDRISIGAMTEAWVDLFDEVVRQPAVPDAPTDRGVRTFDQWRWIKPWADNSAACSVQIHAMMREAGYRRIAWDRPDESCDAVLIRNPVHWPTPDELDAWQRRGLGVAVVPHLLFASPGDAIGPLREKIAIARQDGCSRIAIYGVGQHTRRGAGAVREWLPSIVGFIDDSLPPIAESAFERELKAPGRIEHRQRVRIGGAPDLPFDTEDFTTTAVAAVSSEINCSTPATFAGSTVPTYCNRPVMCLDDAMKHLQPDAIILSSDAWEARMWERTWPWRHDRVVRVYPLYGVYDG